MEEGTGRRNNGGTCGSLMVQLDHLIIVTVHIHVPVHFQKKQKIRIYLFPQLSMCGQGRSFELPTSFCILHVYV